MLSRPISKSADRVLSYLDEQLDSLQHGVEIYLNCRERGYAVFSYVTKRRVAFAEHRSSDSIVLYYGSALKSPRKNDDDDFAFNTNIPSDDSYRRAVFFAYGDDNKCADAIVKYLKGLDTPVAS